MGKDADSVFVADDVVTAVVDGIIRLARGLHGIPKGGDAPVGNVYFPRAPEGTPTIDPQGGSEAEGGRQNSKASDDGGAHFSRFAIVLR